jgi:hypothetical protein
MIPRHFLHSTLLPAAAATFEKERHAECISKKIKTPKKKKKKIPE